MDKLDLDKQNNTENGEEVMLSFEEIINAASGLSEDGSPATAGRIMISEAIDEENVKNDAESDFSGAVIDFFASGGCMVLQADFEKNKTRTLEQILDICAEYMQNSGNEEWLEKKDLIAVMIPLAFYGDIAIILRDLVYFTAFNVDNGMRLIMCFNNIMTELVENDDIDYNELVARVRANEDREEEDLRDQIAAAEQEIKELEEEQNVYGSSVTQKSSYNDIINKEFKGTKEEPMNSGFRFTEDEE